MKDIVRVCWQDSHQCFKTGMSVSEASKLAPLLITTVGNLLSTTEDCIVLGNDLVAGELEAYENALVIPRESVVSICRLKSQIDKMPTE